MIRDLGEQSNSALHKMDMREAPIRVPPKVAADKSEDAAAIIFIHGFSDEAASLESIAHQFQAANKCTWVEWCFPNAMENREAMDRAWYTPTSLSPFPSQRPELEDPEDEDGMMQSIKYLEGLVEELHERGIPLNRIVIGGFSQGCAMSLLMSLVSKYAGQLAGVVGICGYLPLKDRIVPLRLEASLPDKSRDVPIFFARGTRDMLVPRRYFSMCVEKLQELGLRDELLESREYEGMGHGMPGSVLRDACMWLEKVIPRR